MNRTERTLRALRSQAQFEWYQQAAAVARSAEITARVDERVAMLADRVESYLHQLQRAMGRPQFNAALLEAMRRGQRLEQSDLGEWRRRQMVAQRQEQRARATLAAVRNHERSLERALMAERRKCESRRHAAEMIRADEMWLHRSAGEAS